MISLKVRFFALGEVGWYRRVTVLSGSALIFLFLRFLIIYCTFDLLTVIMTGNRKKVITVTIICGYF